MKTRMSFIKIKSQKKYYVAHYCDYEIPPKQN